MTTRTPFGLDIEGYLIAPNRQAPPLVCVAMGPLGGVRVHPWYDWREQVARALLDDSLLIVGHNIAFDMTCLAAEEPDLLPLIFKAYWRDRIACTQVRQKLCDIAAGVYRGYEDVEGATKKLFYGLDDLALRLLGVTLDKSTWRLRFGEFRDANLPIAAWPKGAVQYVTDDVDVALRVYAKQESNAMYLEDQYRQTRASFWLKLMVAWGIRTDAEGVVQLAEKTQQSYEMIAEEMRAEGLLRPKHTTHHRDGTTSEKEPRNVKAVQEKIVAAYRAAGREVPLTDGGKSGNRQPSTNRVTCQESGDPVLIRYAELATLKTVLSKDIPLLERGVIVPIHSYFEELLETARTSSSNPNIQNLRRLPGIRECFVPSCLRCGTVHTALDILAGYCTVCKAGLTVFIDADFGGLELCTLAETCYQLFGYSTLGDALNKKKDPHLMLANRIRRDWSYDVMRAVRKGELDKLTLDSSRSWYLEGGQWRALPSEDDVDNVRQTGKVGNFGFPGGLGPDALVFFALNNYGVKLTRPQAAALKDEWLGEWVEMSDYFKFINAHTRRANPVIKHLTSNRYRGGVSFTEACNSFFQGRGADIAKDVGFQVAEACYVNKASPLFGCRIVNFIHDEYLLLCPEDQAHEAAQELRRIMIEGAAPWLPHVRIDVDVSAMRRYSNDAKAIYKDGRLIPWEPKLAA